REQNERVAAIARLGGAALENSNSYPAWQPDASSPLLKSCTALYGKLFARKPTVEIIHAGLECAVIGSKFPGLDMISFGPTIKDPHTPQERINIESVDHVWKFFLALIASLKNYSGLR
ncbi:MAG: aminoacyl-histidine dipeptidase, partial [bacterium]